MLFALGLILRFIQNFSVRFTAHIMVGVHILLLGLYTQGVPYLLDFTTPFIIRYTKMDILIYLYLAWVSAWPWGPTPASKA